MQLEPLPLLFLNRQRPSSHIDFHPISSHLTPTASGASTSNPTKVSTVVPAFASATTLQKSTTTSPVGFGGPTSTSRLSWSRLSEHASRPASPCASSRLSAARVASKTTFSRANLRVSRSSALVAGICAGWSCKRRPSNVVSTMREWPWA